MSRKEGTVGDQPHTGARLAAPSATLDELVLRARGLIAAGSRRILGITGTPGSGKSTLSVALADALGDDAVLVGMDGFHFANQELRRLGRRDRKGAPDTFDVDGYVALLARLAASSVHDIYAPVFDRALEEPIGSAVPVRPSAKLVITEGNYLLLEEHGWGAVREYLDESWFIDVAPEVRRDRLICRRMSFGHEPDAAWRWVRDVDEVNASVVEETRDRADLVIRFATPV
jgi:pantothenate kinase